MNSHGAHIALTRSLRNLETAAQTIHFLGNSWQLGETPGNWSSHELTMNTLGAHLALTRSLKNLGNVAQTIHPLGKLRGNSGKLGKLELP